MKKNLLLYCFIVLAFSALSVRAEGGHADSVIERARTEARRIAPKLENSTKDFFGDAQDALPETLKPTGEDYAGAFRVIRKNGYFVQEYREHDDFSFLQSTDGEYWMVPLFYGAEVPEGSIEFSEENGELKFAGGGRLSEPEYFPFTYERLLESVNRSELIRNEIEEFLVVQNLKYRIFYAYLRSGKDEYIIPLDSILSEAGLKKDIVYTADDFIRKIDAYYDEESDARMYQEAAEKGEYLYGGGVLSRTEARMREKTAAASQAILPAAKSIDTGSNILPGVIAAVAVLAMGSILLFAKKKKK